MHDQTKLLSADGLARRDAMLQSLQQFMRRRRRRRCITRAAAMTCGAAAAAIAIGAFWNDESESIGGVALRTPDGTNEPVNALSPKPVTDDPTVSDHGRVRIVRITHVEPGLAQRYAPDLKVGGASVVRRVGDEELISILASIGRPSGLVRVQDRAWLTASVAEEPAPNDAESRTSEPDASLGVST